MIGPAAGSGCPGAAAVSAVGVLVSMGGLALAPGALSRWLDGAPPGGLPTAIAVPLMFLGVAVCASWIPAPRGARGDVAEVPRSG